MARVSRRTPKKQPAKRAAGKSARSPAKKASRKAPARQARKGKSASRRAARKAPAKASPRRSARPKRAPRTDAVRRQVARHRPMPPGSKIEAQAEHDHQDPRLAGIPGVSHEGDKVQTENYGQFKNKAVARMDKPTNWFRRAAKPKQ